MSGRHSWRVAWRCPRKFPESTASAGLSSKCARTQGWQSLESDGRSSGEGASLASSCRMSRRSCRGWNYMEVESRSPACPSSVERLKGTALAGLQTRADPSWRQEAGEVLEKRSDARPRLPLAWGPSRGRANRPESCLETCLARRFYSDGQCCVLQPSCLVCCAGLASRIRGSPIITTACCPRANERTWLASISVGNRGAWHRFQRGCWWTDPLLSEGCWSRRKPRISECAAPRRWARGRPTQVRRNPGPGDVFEFGACKAFPGAGPAYWSVRSDPSWPFRESDERIALGCAYPIRLQGPVSRFSGGEG